jgi:16S rRNA (guanine966-N2)-methyltransferase
MRLRIISGEFKGRLINVPQSKEIRPTTDRVRETLFNILNNKIDFEGIKVLDLYSGSGSLGIECISRGAAEVHFVERDLFIYKNLLQNISNLKIDERCKVFNIEASRFSQNASHPTYDLIIADPPFFKDDIYKVVANLKVNRYFSDEGFIIIERSIQTKSLDTENFLTEPFKIIGDACLYEIIY